MQVEVPEELQSQLKTAMQAAQIPVPDSSDRWNLALEALKVHLISYGQLDDFQLHNLCRAQ